MERGWRVNKKCLYVVFWLTRRSRVRRKNAFWGILKHEQQVIAYFQTHYDYGPEDLLETEEPQLNVFSTQLL